MFFHSLHHWLNRIYVVLVPYEIRNSCTPSSNVGMNHWKSGLVIYANRVLYYTLSLKLLQVLSTSLTVLVLTSSFCKVSHSHFEYTAEAPEQHVDLLMQA